MKCLPVVCHATLTSCIFCCLLRSSISKSEGRRWAISSSLCSSSLRCSKTRVSSGFSSSSRPLHGHSESHSHTLSCSVSNAGHIKIRERESRGVLRVAPPVPFMAEQQLPVQVLVARTFRRGAVQLPGLTKLITVVCCGLTGQ